MSTSPQSSWGRWLRRISLGFGILLVVAAVAGSIYEQFARRRAAREFPPTGKLVDIGGRRIHIDCRGSGTPIVVLESGADTSGSTLWVPVQKEVARFTRVCSYDRAGLMWSDPGPLPRDGNSIVSDLRKTLQAAHEQGPYVMVGASLGGPLIMIFTHDFGSEVAGLVFVDAAHPDQIRRLAEAGEKDEPIPLVFKLLADLAWTGLPRLLLPAPVLPELPPQVVQQIAAYQAPSLGPAFDEAAAMPQTLQQAGTFRNLGSRPLAVLSHAKPYDAYPPAQRAGVSREQFDRHLAAWARMQDEEATWSTQSTHRTLNDSSHVVQLERPDAVIEAIREVVGKVQARQNSPTS